MHVRTLISTDTCHTSTGTMISDFHATVPHSTVRSMGRLQVLAILQNVKGMVQISTVRYGSIVTIEEIIPQLFVH